MDMLGITFKPDLMSRKKWLLSSFLILLLYQVFLVETLNLENQRNNLRGKPGQGYYLEVDIGTPPQKV
jgi:hypothetical protein